MRIFYLSLVFLLYNNLFVVAQRSITVRDAELSFANKAKEVNTKTAFLTYLDSSGVVFNRGRVLNGLKAWQHAPEEGPKLLWVPAMSLMSTQGDLGFTTGPFEVRLATDSLLSCGQYTTIWKRNKSGEWKVLADLGTGYSTTAYPGQLLSEPAEQLSPADSPFDVYQMDTVLSSELKLVGSAAYDSRIAPYSILNKEGSQPMQLKENILHALAELSPKIEFTPIGWGVAGSRDLAYVYGQMKSGSNIENYLRIWGHTQKGWILLLQVIKF